MSFLKFKPIIWINTFEKELDKQLVFKENCNLKYEGSATKAGESVKILSYGTPEPKRYSDGVLHAPGAPESIEDTSMMLPINEVAQINIGIDDLDKRQAEGGEGLLADAIKEQKEKVAAQIDAYIAGLVTDSQVAKNTITTKLTKDTILDVIDSSLLMLRKNDVSMGTKVTLTAPPDFISLLRRTYIELDTDNSDMIKHGKCGMYNGIVLKESNQVYNDGTYFNIQVKTDRALSFVNPHTHMQPYTQTSEGWNDVIKGWTIFGGKVTRPKEIVNLQVKFK